MIAFAKGLGKACTRCGEFKKLDEFYIHSSKPRKDGTLKTSSACKACVKRRVAKKHATNRGVKYRPIEEYRTALKPCKSCGAMRERRQDGKLEKCTFCNPSVAKKTEWEKACLRELSKIRCRKNETEWSRRLESARVSLRRRPKGSSKRTRPTLGRMQELALMVLNRKENEGYGLWNRKFSNAISSLRKRQRSRAQRNLKTY